MWYYKVGKEHIAISSRVRFARNFKGYNFPHIMKKEEVNILINSIESVIDNKEIKLYEIKTDFNLVKNSQMDSIREMILLNSQNPNFVINCPICGEKLITRIAKLYDLEDNLILRPKARCSKCPFQLID